MPLSEKTPHGQQAADDAETIEVLSLGTGAPLEKDGRPVHELVAEVARADPTRIAVCARGSEIDYGALYAWSGRIAARLAAAGLGRGSRVGLLTEPSIAGVAAIVGILRAGAAYVPIDLAQPDERIAAVLADAGAAGVVVAGSDRARPAGLGLPLVCVKHDGDESEPAGPVPDTEVSAQDEAYLIYTSGSTGEPKGVLVDHGRLAASTRARHAVYPGAPVFLLVSPLAFDSSVAGLWGTLTVGGRLIVAASEEVRDPERLVELIEQNAVTTLLSVPSLYAVLLDAAERRGTRRLSSLQEVITAGEPLSHALTERHFALHATPVALVNEYGPTEATVWASYHRLETPGPVSIGGPIPGARLYVLDEELRLVPRGTEGELFIGGQGVAVGYVGRPEATAQAFLKDPFVGPEPGRMYRTGDLVRWNDRGTLDFLGRRDHQVKIRGHRVELGAVESVLRDAPGVHDVVVVPADGLTAFVAAPQGTDPQTLRDRVAQHLPAVMVPGRVQVLDALPLTTNGKADRTRLQALADEIASAPPRTTPNRAALAPAGDTTSQVAAAWAEVLKVDDPLPLDVNFFDLGGHSLTMFQLQEALERHTGVRPSVVSLFRKTTISAQAELTQADRTRSEAGPADGRSDFRGAQALRARRLDTRNRGVK